MTLRPPLRSGLSTLKYEPLSEQLSALGYSGRAAESALAALAARDGLVAETESKRLVDVADQAVCALFEQREICGMTNGQDVIERTGDTSKLLARLGAAPRHR